MALFNHVNLERCPQDTADEYPTGCYDCYHVEYYNVGSYAAADEPADEAAETETEEEAYGEAGCADGEAGGADGEAGGADGEAGGAEAADEEAAETEIEEAAETEANGEAGDADGEAGGTDGVDEESAETETEEVAETEADGEADGEAGGVDGADEEAVVIYSIKSQMENMKKIADEIFKSEAVWDTMGDDYIEPDIWLLYMAKFWGGDQHISDEVSLQRQHRLLSLKFHPDKLKNCRECTPEMLKFFGHYIEPMHELMKKHLTPAPKLWFPGFCFKCGEAFNQHKTKCGLTEAENKELKNAIGIFKENKDRTPWWNKVHLDLGSWDPYHCWKCKSTLTRCNRGPECHVKQDEKRYMRRAMFAYFKNNGMIYKGSVQATLAHHRDDESSTKRPRHW
jgi:hypothetical protein